MFEIDELIKATGAVVVQPAVTGAIKGISIDSRTIRPQEAFVAIRGDTFDGHNFIDEAVKKGASCVIVEASKRQSRSYEAFAVQHKQVALLEAKDTVKALGHIAQFHRRRFDIPVIAVTGSNGKTTTKEMIAWVLSKKFKVLKNEGTKNNHIGVPLTLLNLSSSHEIAVLEIGTNHFGEIDYLSRLCQPTMAVITNIGPSHLEHFLNTAGVLKEKCSLLAHLHKPALAFLNSDDAQLKKKTVALRKRKGMVIGFGLKNRCDFKGSAIEPSRQSIAFTVNDTCTCRLATVGSYNVYNALAAVAVARVFSLSYEEISERLAGFDFPKGRLQLKRFQMTTVIDDTYNSNPLSLKHALDSLSQLPSAGRKILVMGDMLELGSQKERYHAKAGEQAARVCDILITVGQLSRAAAAAAKQAGFDIKNIFSCNSCSQAKEILCNVISLNKDDVVLVKGSRSMKMEEIFSEGLP